MNAILIMENAKKRSIHLGTGRDGYTIPEWIPDSLNGPPNVRQKALTGLQQKMSVWI